MSVKVSTPSVIQVSATTETITNSATLMYPVPRNGVISKLFVVASEATIPASATLTISKETGEVVTQLTFSSALALGKVLFFDLTAVANRSFKPEDVLCISFGATMKPFNASVVFDPIDLEPALPHRDIDKSKV